jgi:hypothetical protein
VTIVDFRLGRLSLIATTRRRLPATAGPSKGPQRLPWAPALAGDRGEIVEVLPELATVGQPLSLMGLKSKPRLPKVNTVIERLTCALKTG